MADDVIVNIRVDADLKDKAEKIFNEFGMDISTAFNLFIRQVLREGKIPFEILPDTPNQDTISAMLEAESIAFNSSVKGYTDTNELFTDLKK